MPYLEADFLMNIFPICAPTINVIIEYRIYRTIENETINQKSIHLQNAISYDSLKSLMD